jgi:hypothetical protein
MAVEALCVLGHPDRAIARAENDDGPDVELPKATQRIKTDEWRGATGRIGRWGDWKELYLAELSEARWQDVLDRWCARFAPGICAAATHGAIRTAHAARALSRRDTPERRGELARGLGYWAAAYQELPTRASDRARASSYADALERVPLLSEKLGRTPDGSIVEGLRRLSDLDGFADARDLVAMPEDVGAGLSALSATFAREYLRHGTRNDAIAFVHAVTGPCALRRIAPHVKPETARAAFPYAWQAAAGIHAAYARKQNEPRAVEPKLAPPELVVRAVENGDDHAIKFTEVLLAEHAIAPDPVYLAAAEDAVARL